MSAAPRPDAGVPATDVDAIAHLLRDAIGMRPSAVSTIRLRHAASAMAADARIEVSELAARLRADPAMCRRLVDRVTVQESQFFRDASFFDALRTRILPELTGPLTVWSAACAHGQEAWSVAMLLSESGRHAWRILATDVSGAAVARARTARFAPRELRGLSDERRARFMDRDAAGATVTAALRERVTFAEHNLVLDAPPGPVATARLVLLRNVLIYFEQAEIAALFTRLAALLPAGAWVVLGGSEVLHPIAGFELVRADGLYAYRATGRSQAGDAPPAAPPAGAAVATPPIPRVAGAIALPVAAPDGDRLRHDAERHAAAGDHGQAVTCFRRLVYLDSEDPAARLSLALALDAADERDAARRAYRATLAALERLPAGHLPERLAGYGIDEVRALLRERLADRETVA